MQPVGLANTTLGSQPVIMPKNLSPRSLHWTEGASLVKGDH